MPLFARSLNYLRDFDRGFRNNDVLLVSFDPTRARMSATELREFNRSVLASVEQLPDIRTATLAALTPLEGGGMSRPFIVNGVSSGAEDVYFNVVGPRFFHVMHTPVLRGREFTSQDDATRPLVAVVNEAFVRQYVPDGDALGQRVALTGPADEMLIVGVVKDAVYETLRAPAPATVYLSYLQHRGRPMTLVLEASSGVAAAAAAVRSVVQPKVPAQPLRIRTLAAQVEGSLIRERLIARLTTGFAVLAMLLAAVGLYGLIAYSVTNRTREIGVRLALGANQGTIERSIFGQSLRVVAVGTVLGLPLAYALASVVGGMIVGVSPVDPATMSGAVAALAIVAVLAAAVPARRASRVDPATSLRFE